MEMNSTLPEAQRLREWWKQGGESQNITTISREGGGGGMRLAQIAKERPSLHCNPADQLQMSLGPLECPRAQRTPPY